MGTPTPTLSLNRDGAPLVSIRHVWIGITLAAAFIGPASAPFGVPDGLWSLLRGAWMASHRALLQDDPFTSAPHVAGPMLNVQWLADLALYSLEVLGGLPLVITATALVVTVTYGLLLVATYTVSSHLRVSCVAVGAAYVLGATNFSPRPQTFTYALFVLFVLAIVRAEWRRDTRLLWLLPPAMAVWANLHGSFFVAFLLLGCATAARILIARQLHPAQPYMITVGACLLASFINPYGPGALVYVVSIGGNSVIRDMVTEWSPTTVAWPEGLMFFASLAVLGGVLLRARERVTAHEALTLLAFGFLAWSSVRAIVWFGIVLAPPLARLLGTALPFYRARGKDRPVVNLLVLAAALALAALSTPWTKSALPILPPDKRGLFNSQAPIGVGNYLRAHDPPQQGRMFNHQSWGGYLEWATWPRHQVFVDGRIELHPSRVWLDYLEIVFPSARWRSLFDHYDISYAVLSKAEEFELVADLRDDPAWRADYEDDQAVVFTRSSGGP